MQHAICSNCIFKYISKLLIQPWSPAHSFPLLLWHPQTLREHCNWMDLIVLGQASKSWASHQLSFLADSWWEILNREWPIWPTCLSRTQFSRCLSLQDLNVFQQIRIVWLRHSPKEKRNIRISNNIQQYSKHPEIHKKLIAIPTHVVEALSV